MANTATEWLKGNRDYHEGLQILQANGASTFLVEILSSGPDAYNTLKLLEEIQNLKQDEVIDQPLPEHSPADSILVETPEQKTKPYIPNDDLERKLRVDSAIRQLFKEITHLHGKLIALPSGEELHQVARSIKIKQLKKQDLWDQLHYFNKNGRWFSPEPVVNVAPENIHQAIKNLMSVRAKAKKHLTKPLDAGRRATFEKKIADVNEQIDKLREAQK